MKVLAVDANKVAALARSRERMEHGVPWSASMLHALDRDGFVLTHVRHGGGSAWFVRVSPPRPLQEGFGLAPEVLIIVVGGEVQARTLHEASVEVVQSGLRLLIERTVDAVADELCEALRRRMRVAGEETLRGDRGGLAGWKAAGEALLDQDRRLCVVIDEYDLLFEDESGAGAIPGIGRLFRLLRGWAQTRQGTSP